LFGLTGPEGNHGEDVKEEFVHSFASLIATDTSILLRPLRIPT
jgi:hypothetical protein